jgi:PAS domain S-box-containing protein
MTRRPIRVRLMTMSAVTSSLSLLLACSAFLGYELLTFKDRLLDSMTAEAHMLAFSLTSPVLFDDPQAATVSLAALKAKANTRSATVTSKDGSVIATFGKPGPALPLEPGSRQESRDDGDRLLLTVAVTSDDAVIGAVTIESSLEVRNQRIKRYLAMTVGILGLSLLVSLALSLRLQRGIVQPVMKLTEAARRVSEQRDYTVRVDLDDEGELGLLGNTFNEMLGQLEQESEKRFTRLVEGVKDYAIFMVSDTGRIETWNSGAARLTGYDTREIIGQPFEIMCTPEDLAIGAALEGLKRAAKEGRVEQEVWRVRKDGSRFWADVVTTAVLDSAGKVRGYLNITRDMTERRKAEEKFRGLLESAPDAMVITGEDDRIALVNVQTERLFGYTRDELVGQSIDLLVPSRPSGQSAEVADQRHGVRKDKGEFPVEITSSPLETSDGTLRSSAIRDITERKRAELALKVANKELEAFSYSVAHDLRAPLRGMNGFATILLDEYSTRLDAEGLDCLNEIHSNAVKMAGLIDSLLSLSRVTRADLNPEEVDISLVARSIAERLALAEPGRKLELHIEDGLRAELDPHLARTLVENLVGNAWKFTRDAAVARIEVGSALEDGIRAFYVRDNGAGFDMAYAKKLFGPFQRLHTAAEFPGTGIGLATVQRIVHRHGGRIWAQGAVGHGATIFFTLPPVTNGASR